MCYMHALWYSAFGPPNQSFLNQANKETTRYINQPPYLPGILVKRENVNG